LRSGIRPLRRRHGPYHAPYHGTRCVRGALGSLLDGHKLCCRRGGPQMGGLRRLSGDLLHVTDIGLTVGTTQELPPRSHSMGAMQGFAAARWVSFCNRKAPSSAAFTEELTGSSTGSRVSMMTGPERSCAAGPRSWTPGGSSVRPSGAPHRIPRFTIISGPKAQFRRPVLAGRQPGRKLTHRSPPFESSR